jgi:alkylated DNA repair dioxygenase AlkB
LFDLHDAWTSRRSLPARRNLRSAQPPEGIRYRSQFVEAGEEQALLLWIRTLPLSAFEFHGYLARRRVVSFGWKYLYDSRVLAPATPIPPSLFPLRERAAVFAGCRAEELVQSTVAEYRAGTMIGWHRDKPMFEEVIGVSLRSPCMFRLRRRLGRGDSAAWQRYSFLAEPRSVYMLSGPARTDFEHSIPAVASLRYSITFRTLRDKVPRSAPFGRDGERRRPAESRDPLSSRAKRGTP